MIIGIGIDIVEVDRIERAARRRPAFLARVFTEREREYCAARSRSFESFAARFAAKEAFLKALGTPAVHGIGWHDMEVVRDGEGRPELVLRGAALATARSRGAVHIRVSLSHTRDHGTAVVVLEGTGPVSPPAGP